MRRFLASLPPFFLPVYPGSLRPFIELAGGDGAFRRLTVRGVLAGSESFLPGRQTPVRAGVRHPYPRTGYGHSEYLVVALTAGNATVSPSLPDLRHGGAAAQAGESGPLRILARRRQNRLGTQFWRYETGDLALPAPGTCTAPTGGYGPA